MQRRLTWPVLVARGRWRGAHGMALGNLLAIPVALIVLLALSPGGPLQFGTIHFSPASLGAIRAEAAPPRPPSAGQAARTLASVGTTSAASAHVATEGSTRDGGASTPPAMVVSAVQQDRSSAPVATATPTPVVTPTPSPTATVTPSPTPTATPTATATATPTETPNPFANDKLTDISRIPGWQTINWAAYVPTPVATAVPGVTGTGQFIMPASGFISTQYNPAHLAIDIAGPLGTAVLAGDTGTVVFAGLDYGGLGYAVEIDHGNGFVSAYGHNSVLKVHVGAIVRRGDVIAIRGSTGHSTGPHVHFAVHKDGQPVDPFNYVIAGDPPAPAPQVRVPNLAGSTQGDALNALKGLTLQLTVDLPQPSTAVPAGKLAVQQPAAGSLADINSAVHISLSSGPPTPTPASTPAATASAAAPPPVGATVTPDSAATAVVTQTATAPSATAEPAATVSEQATAGATGPATPTTVTAVPALTATASASPTAVRGTATATPSPNASKTIATPTPRPHPSASPVATAR